ncbi:hypothetical protein, partial [Acinetobacter defluvii]|uniref:hypothetical protein n=1 Tax=Acinetobacter defluvii TaxID=1871111 RepID=UPI001C08931D
TKSNGRGLLQVGCLKSPKWKSPVISAHIRSIRHKQCKKKPNQHKKTKFQNISLTAKISLNESFNFLYYVF